MSHRQKIRHLYGKAEFDKDEHLPAPIRSDKQEKTNQVLFLIHSVVTDLGRVIGIPIALLITI